MSWLGRPYRGLIIAFAAISGLAMMAAISVAQTAPIKKIEIISVIGPELTNSRRLNHPCAVAVNDANEIYIADYGNDRIVKLDSAYNLIAEYGGYGQGEISLNGPASIALDVVSNVYVVDSGNRWIRRLDRMLNLVSIHRNLQNSISLPVCIDISPRGEIIFGDEGAGGFFILDPLLNSVTEFVLDWQGSGARFGRPSAISIDHRGNIYVCDIDLGSVVIFDEFGSKTGSIGEEILKRPTGIGISPLGVWVADELLAGLVCFYADSRETFFWPGEKGKKLIKPKGLAVTQEGLIVLTDAGADEIFVLQPIIGD